MARRGPDGSSPPGPAPCGLAPRVHAGRASEDGRGEPTGPELAGLDADRRAAAARATAAGRPRMPSPQAVTDRRAPRPERDGALRRGGIVPLDGQNRIAAGRLLATLSLAPGQPIVATCQPGQVVLRAGTASIPIFTSVPIDTQRRLTLPPPVTGSLAVLPGEQVLAVAVPATGELLLCAAADVLQELTGPLPAARADAAAGNEAAEGVEPARRRVRDRWQPS